MKLAAQLFTVREFTKTQEDIEKTLKKVKAMGYKSIQVSTFGPYDPFWLADKVKELDLEICASHTPLDRILNDTDAVIREHKAWNCKYIGLGWSEGPKPTKAEYDEWLNAFETPLKKMEDNGMLFLYHNHQREFQPYCPNADMNCIEYIAQKYPANQLGFLFDFYWTEYAGANAIELIDKYADRLHVVHFKDMLINANGDKQITEMGNGFIDYKKIYERLRSTPIETVAVEQDNSWTVGPFESLKTSYDYLTKLADFE